MRAAAPRKRVSQEDQRLAQASRTENKPRGGVALGFLSSPPAAENKITGGRAEHLQEQIQGKNLNMEPEWSHKPWPKPPYRSSPFIAPQETSSSCNPQTDLAPTASWGDGKGQAATAVGSWGTSQLYIWGSQAEVRKTASPAQSPELFRTRFLRSRVWESRKGGVNITGYFWLSVG